MKCQNCHNPATLHITEIVSDDQFEEYHLCETCAHKFSHDPQPVSPKAALSDQLAEADEGILLSTQECPLCGINFVEFRNTGRLGCPNDYHEFREELLPLLENIHGETRHCGKTPRRYPQTQQTQSELMQLRNHLKDAVTQENYEEAAKIRDRIKELEES